MECPLNDVLHYRSYRSYVIYEFRTSNDEIINYSLLLMFHRPSSSSLPSLSSGDDATKPKEKDFFGAWKRTPCGYRPSRMESSPTMELNLNSDLVVSVGILVATFILQYVSNKLIERSQKKADLTRLRNENMLARIDFQLGEVFGPLRAILKATKGSFSNLVSRHTNRDPNNLSAIDIDTMYEKIQENNIDGTLNDVQKDWMLWIRYILQPQNRIMLNIITTKANGFDNHIPNCFIEVMAHITEFEVILVKWENKDFSHMITTIPFNDRVNVYVESEYERLVKKKLKIWKELDRDFDTENHFDDGPSHMKLVREPTSLGQNRQKVSPSIEN